MMTHIYLTCRSRGLVDREDTLQRYKDALGPDRVVRVYEGQTGKDITELFAARVQVDSRKQSSRTEEGDK